MKTHEIKTFRKTYKQYIKPCVFDGYKLAVLFDEKDSVKQHGARWDGDAEHWWMPKNKLTDEVQDSNSALVIDWLNANHMIVGQYCRYGGDNADAGYIIQNGTPKVYSIMKNNNVIDIAWYPEYDAVKFSGGEQSSSGAWKTIEKGREFWDSLIQGGYNRMHGTHPENV